MFDIGFTELMVIGLVALLVIGPEKLPRVARTVGHLAGRLQRYVSDVKADINREVELDELRKMRDSVQQAASEIQGSMQGELQKAESDLNSAAAALNADPAPVPPIADPSPAPQVPDNSPATVPNAAAPPEPPPAGGAEAGKTVPPDAVRAP